MELTCSFKKNIDSANLRKHTNYLDLKTDIEEAGCITNLVPFEVGSRGQITTRNKKSIMESCKRNSLKMKHILIMKEMSKISLLCSFAIFQARGQPSCQDPPLLHPQDLPPSWTSRLHCGSLDSTPSKSLYGTVLQSGHPLALYFIEI